MERKICVSGLLTDIPSKRKLPFVFVVLKEVIHLNSQECLACSNNCKLRKSI